MQETRVQRVRNSNSQQRRKLKVDKYGCWGLAVVLIGGLLPLMGCVGVDATTEPVESISTSIQSISTETTEPITFVEETEAPIVKYAEPNMEAYPYALTREEWGEGLYDDEEFTYYEIPHAYKVKGGMFPEVAQAYLWRLCKEVGVDYYTVLALIERESGYRYYAEGDYGKSKGLMQVQERWHTERMRSLDVTDLFHPYSNMRVGVDYLKEMQDKYLASGGANGVLMAYNMGASTAKKYWAEGIYSTEYSRGILQRALEIKQELQDT